MERLGRIGWIVAAALALGAGSAAVAAAQGVAVDTAPPAGRMGQDGPLAVFGDAVGRPIPVGMAIGVITDDGADAEVHVPGEDGTAQRLYVREGADVRAVAGLGGGWFSGASGTLGASLSVELQGADSAWQAVGQDDASEDGNGPKLRRGRLVVGLGKAEGTKTYRAKLSAQAESGSDRDADEATTTLTLVAFGEADLGSISGKVADAEGQALAGARIFAMPAGAAERAKGTMTMLGVEPGEVAERLRERFPALEARIGQVADRLGALAGRGPGRHLGGGRLVAVSDAAGAYNLAKLPPGDWILVAVKAGYRPSVYGGAERPVAGTPVGLEPGGAATGIDLTMTAR